MRTRLFTFGIWALVAGSLLFWGLRLFVPRTVLPAQAQLPARHVAMGGDLHRLLGSSAAPADAGNEEAADDGADRYQLLGVVAPRGAGHSPQGVALISVGGEPARAWRTGATVEDDVVLLSVSRRGAQLGPRGGPATTELTLPDPSPSRGAAPGLPGLPQFRPGMPANGQIGGIQQPGAGQIRPMGQPQGMVPPGMQPGQAGVRPNGQAAQNADDEDEDEE